MKRRLILAFALLFGLFSIGIGASIYFHWQSSEEMLGVITGHQIEELRHDLSYRLHQSQRDLQASGTLFAAQLDEIIANVEALDRAVDSCGGCHHDEERRQKFQSIATLVEQYKSEFSTVITAILDTEMRDRLLMGANTTAAEIDIQIDRMLDTATATLSLRTEQALAQVDRSWKILAITLLSTLVLAILTTVTLVRGITEPVRSLVEATERIHQGDLGYQIDHSERHEFGRLMDSFNDMSTTLASNQERLDSHVARLRSLNRAVFSLYATPNQEALRERLTRGLRGLLDVEMAGTVLEAGVENVYVMSLERHGETVASSHHGLSGSQLQKIYRAAEREPIVCRHQGDVEWPFSIGREDRPRRNFAIAWIVFNGELRGALVAADKLSGEFVEDDVQVLVALANGVAEAIENIRLYQELHERV